MQPKILCILPFLPKDYSSQCVESVLQQDVMVSQVLMILNRGQGGTLPARISDALNRGLDAVDLSKYDYLLRVDSDMILPVDFLRCSLALNADVVGRGGQAHLIRVAPFLKAMGGKFNVVSDDAYLEYKFLKEGYVWRDWVVEPKVQRLPGHTHGIRYFTDRGMVMYACGFEPFHVFGSFVWDARNVFSVLGYFKAVLHGVSRLDVAPFVFWSQIKRLKKFWRRRK